MRCFFAVEVAGLIIGSILVGYMVVAENMIKSYLDALVLVILIPLAGFLLTVLPAVLFSLVITVIAIRSSRSSHPMRNVVLQALLLAVSIWIILSLSGIGPDIDDSLAWFGCSLVAACLSGWITLFSIRNQQVKHEEAQPSPGAYSDKAADGLTENAQE